MPSHLDTIRTIHRLAACVHPSHPIDADLREEAGMDGNLARLLQAARDLDAEAANHPPGSMLTGAGCPSRWFSFTLAFSADSGADLDTVRAYLGLSRGWMVNVKPARGDALDVVFSALEQDDDPAADFPVFLVGHRYNDSHTADNDYRGEPVRIPLAGARITIY
jgi:hypothetical protein